MKQYVEMTSKGIVCTHPEVKKITEWGGTSAIKDGPVSYYISVVLKNGIKVDFGGLQSGKKTLTDCNEYLDKI